MAFRDIENLDSTQFTLLTWFMWGTGLLLTILRLVVRYQCHGRWFWDDTFQVAGMISLTALAVVTELQRDTIYEIKAAFTLALDSGRGLAIQTTSATREIAKLQFVSIILFWLCLWSIKASLLMFYRRLFAKLNGYMKWWWLVAIVCITTFFACNLANLLECLPLERRFQHGLQSSCPPMNSTIFLALTTSLDNLTDILLMALPIKLLRGLRISMKEKIGIGCIFVLSILTMIFSVCRISEVYASLLSLNPNFNVSFSLWSMLEASIAVVVGALPSLKVLIQRRRESSQSSSRPKLSHRHSPNPNVINTPSLHNPPTKVDTPQITNGRREGPYYEDQEENQGIVLRDMKGRGITRDVRVSFDDAESEQAVSFRSFLQS